MTRRLNRVLPGRGTLGYDRRVTATLKALDVYPMYSQTSASVDRVRKVLAEPLGYTAPEDDPDCLVHGQVLPEDTKTNKLYLTFHLIAKTRRRSGARYLPHTSATGVGLPARCRRY